MGKAKEPESFDVVPEGPKGIPSSIWVQFYQDFIAPLKEPAGEATKLAGLALRTVRVLAEGVGIVLKKGTHCGPKFWQDFWEQAKEIPPERLVERVSPIVAVPLLENAANAEEEPDLRKMYANLLSKAVDLETITQAHPSFSHIISQLTPDEAIMLKYLNDGFYWPCVRLNGHEISKRGGVKIIIDLFSWPPEGVAIQYPKLTGLYLRNLERVKLVDINLTGKVLGFNYDSLVGRAIHWKRKVPEDLEPIWENGYATLTELGAAFRQACCLFSSSSLADPTI